MKEKYKRNEIKNKNNQNYNSYLTKTHVKKIEINQLIFEFDQKSKIDKYVVYKEYLLTTKQPSDPRYFGYRNNLKPQNPGKKRGRRKRKK